jgi:hypothetical protein
MSDQVKEGMVWAGCWEAEKVKIKLTLTGAGADGKMT